MTDHEQEAKLLHEEVEKLKKQVERTDGLRTVLTKKDQQIRQLSDGIEAAQAEVDRCHAATKQAAAEHEGQIK